METYRTLTFLENTIFEFISTFCRWLCILTTMLFLSALPFSDSYLLVYSELKCWVIFSKFLQPELVYFYDYILMEEKSL